MQQSSYKFREKIEYDNKYRVHELFTHLYSSWKAYAISKRLDI